MIIVLYMCNRNTIERYLNVSKTVNFLYHMACTLFSIVNVVVVDICRHNLSDTFHDLFICVNFNLLDSLKKEYKIFFQMNI